MVVIIIVVLSKCNYFSKISLHKSFSEDHLYKILQNTDQGDLNTRTGVLF